MKIFLLLFIVQSILVSQTIDPKFEKQILEHFGKRNYKRCVDDGVKYLIENGNEDIKRDILFAKRNLESYDSTKLVETDSLITICLNQLPELIPKYAIYAGLAEVTYWMMVSQDISEEDHRRIFSFSLKYFKKAIDSTPNDSNYVLSRIYLEASDIGFHFGGEEFKDDLVYKAYGYSPTGYREATEYATLMEKNGFVDSCEVILSKLYNTNPQKYSQENVYEFIRC